MGSNTVHLLVVDAHRGGHPTPMTSEKNQLRLAEHLERDGSLSKKGADALVRVVGQARDAAANAQCDDLLAFATSALRDATNSAAVLSRVREDTSVALQVLPGDDEARYTFLAVRRWYGWSAGRLTVLDIGGGSLELASGRDEHPSTAVSLPLGAGRLTRDFFVADPPTRQEIAVLREKVDADLGVVAGRFTSAGEPDLAVGTSKTFRSLARLTGAVPYSAGPRARRVLTHAALRQLVSFVSRMSSEDIAELEGVSPGRSRQLAAGALVAEASMRALKIDTLEICPWALREGVILRRLDTLDGSAQSDRSAQDSPGELGGLTPFGARCTG